MPRHAAHLKGRDGTDGTDGGEPRVDLPAGEDGAAFEARLRTELATAIAPAAPALELAGFLAQQERPFEALAVLDAAIVRADEPALRVARAGMYRDLGQRHRAVLELRGLRSRFGANGMHPGLLFELAELEWLEGERAAAELTIDELRREHAVHPWMRSHGVETSALTDEIRSESRPRRLRLRDLLGNLRGGLDPTERLRTLDTLVGLGGETAAKAITIGLLAEDPLLRTRALQRFDAALPGFTEASLLAVCSAAMSDPAAIVRTAAAARLGRVGVQAVPVLLQAMEQESDAEVFAAAHASLRALLGAGPQPPAEDGHDESARRAVVAYWRSRWEH